METKRWSDMDGYTVEIFEQDDNTWIRLATPGKPVPSGSSFSPHAKVEPVTHKAYLDGLRKLGKDPKDYRMVCGVLIRVAAVPFVESVMEELRAAEANAKAELLRNVPGLEELRSARADQDRYHEQFERMMEDESNDGAMPPKPVRLDPADVAQQYPVAAAYLKAESWEHAAHYAKSAAGRRAKARIATGEDYTLVLAEMEQEWAAHVEQHAWD